MKMNPAAGVYCRTVAQMRQVSQGKFTDKYAGLANTERAGDAGE